MEDGWREDIRLNGAMSRAGELDGGFGAAGLAAASKAVRCRELRVARGEVVHAADCGREGGSDIGSGRVVGRPRVRP